MSEEIKNIVKTADAFCFDVDSTVIVEESIDELAKYYDKGEEIAALTEKAMGGHMTLQEALTKRLNILQPSYNRVKNFIENHHPKLSTNIDILIRRLQSKRIPIHLVSGGFRCIIKPIAMRLNIPHENIHANRLKFYFNGDYAGFDEEASTSQTGGKAVVMETLKKKHGYKNLVIVGDGVTDLEACPPADGFVGYGGNVIRQYVKENAKWFVTDFKEIFDVI